MTARPPVAAVAPSATAPSPSADGLEDSDPPEVFVESTWRSRVVRYDREQQSESAPPKDAANQSRSMRSGGVSLAHNRTRSSQHQPSASQRYQTESVSTAALSADAPLPAGFGPFLTAAYPVLSAQLEANARSHAFDDYLSGSGSGGSWGEESREGVENLFALAHQQALADLSRPEENGASSQQQSSSSSKSSKSRSTRSNAAVDPTAGGGSVLGLSWSCNGSVLAASYGRSDHVGWCNHSSATLAFWNIMRRQIDCSRADFTLETECCCMCIAYHPERPTIIAGGMFNGEIRVWDTSLLESAQAGGAGNTVSAAEDDSAAPAAGSTSSSNSNASTLAADAGNPLLMRSRIDDYFHREPIARLEWVRDPLSRVWSLVSVAGDGKVLFWSLESDNKLRFPTEGYTLSPSERWDGHHHTDALGAGISAARNKFHVLGGTAVAFGPQTSASSGDAGGSSSAASGGAAHYFVAATEGGGLVRVSLSILPKRKGYLAKGAGGDPSLKWSREAHRFLENSDPASRFDLRKSIERFVKNQGGPAGSTGDTVELEHIFQSRPPAAQLYPSAASAVAQSFEAHSGPVYGLAFNCFDRRIFASASTDGRIKLFHVNHSKPLLTLESGSDYLFSLVWSPARPLVFAVSDGSGSIRVYDLQSSMLGPALTIQANTDRTALQSLVFNVQEPALIACADVKGRINVFNLAPKFAQMQPGERRLLEQMGAMSSQA